MLGLGLRKPRFGFELLTEIKISLHLYQHSDFPIKTFHSAPYVSLPLLRALKWGTVWTFISRDIRYTKSQTFGFPDLLNKTGLFWNFWLWRLVTLIPLEVKLHSVPHFKALNSDDEISGWKGHGRTFFMYCQSTLILLHKTAYRSSIYWSQCNLVKQIN